MIKNYLRIAYRNFLKQKASTAINIFGLSLGLASAILIYLYIDSELTFDHYFDEHERLYVLGSEFQQQGNTNHFTAVPGGWTSHLLETVPEIESITKIDWFGYPTTIHHKPSDKVVLSEDVRWVTRDFAKTLTIDLVSGNLTRALEHPGGLLISERASKLLFGDSDPMEQPITFRHPWIGNGAAIELVVTGVYKDFPANVHFHPMYLANAEAMKPNFSERENGFDNYFNSMGLNGGFFPTYLKLKPGSNVDNLQKEIDRLAQQTEQSDSAFAAEGGKYRAHIRKLTDLHFDSQFSMEANSRADKKYITVFSSVAVLILIIASINYMNLATARSGKRAKEVGMRKSLGGKRGELAGQFYLESLIMAIASALMAFLLVVLALPYFNTLSNKLFTLTDLFTLKVIVVVACIVLFVALVGGSYPALFLSGFKPVEVLKGRFTAGKGPELFRKILVGIQFIVSIIMVIATVVIIRQMDHMQESKLNERGDQILSIRYGGAAPAEKYQPFKNALLQDPELDAVTMGNHLPRMDWFGPTGAVFSFSEISSDEYEWHQLNVDFDFPSVFNLELVAGRIFDKEGTSDSSSFLLNMSAVNALGKTPEEVIGLSGLEVRANAIGKVIGVVKDFPFQSAYHKIEPLVINPRLHFIDKIVYVVVPKGKMTEKIASIEATWKKVLPGVGFDYWFLNDEFNRMYQTERTISLLARSFTVLALLITGLGLYGLASYTAEQKTKEVGIRKVLGASVGSVVVLFLRRFAQIFIVAVVVSVPLAWYLGDNWLKSFVYRKPLTPAVFVFSVSAVLLLSFVTIVFEIYRASIADPVRAIKHE